MIFDIFVSAWWTATVFCLGYFAFWPTMRRIRRECVSILETSEAIDLAAKKLIEEYHDDRAKARERSLANIRAAAKYLAGPSEGQPPAAFGQYPVHRHPGDEGTQVEGS